MPSRAIADSNSATDKPTADPWWWSWSRSVVMLLFLAFMYCTSYKVNPMHTGTVVDGTTVSADALTGTGATLAGNILTRQIVSTASGVIRIEVGEVTCATSGVQWEQTGTIVVARVVDAAKLIVRGGAAAIGGGSTNKYVETIVADGMKRHLQKKCASLEPEAPIRANLEEWSAELAGYLNTAMADHGIEVESVTMATKFTGKLHSIDENDNERVAAPSRALAAKANQAADQAEANRLLQQVTNAIQLNLTQVQARINATQLEAASAAKLLAAARNATLAHEAANHDNTVAFMAKMRGVLGDALFDKWLFTTAIAKNTGTLMITDAAHPPVVTAPPGGRS